MSGKRVYVWSRSITNLAIIGLTMATTLLVWSFGWHTNDGLATVRELALLLSFAYCALHVRRQQQFKTTSQQGYRDPWLVNHLDLAVYCLIVFILVPYFV